MKIQVPLARDYRGDPANEQLLDLIAGIIASLSARLNRRVRFGFSPTLIGTRLQKLFLTGFEGIAITAEILLDLTKHRFKSQRHMLTDFALMCAPNWKETYISVTFSIDPRDFNHTPLVLPFTPAVSGKLLEQNTFIDELLINVDPEDKPVFRALIATMRNIYQRGVLRFTVHPPKRSEYKMAVTGWTVVVPQQALSLLDVNEQFTWTPLSPDRIQWSEEKNAVVLTLGVRSKNNHRGGLDETLTPLTKRRRTDSFMPMNMAESVMPQ